MNLSMKWLKEFVDIDIKPRDFSEAMTISGSKVEGYEIEGSEISIVVVGNYLLFLIRIPTIWLSVKWISENQNQFKL